MFECIYRRHIVKFHCCFSETSKSSGCLAKLVYLKSYFGKDLQMESLGLP